jgi:hypothetical protein
MWNVELSHLLHDEKFFSWMNLYNMLMIDERIY